MFIKQGHEISTGDTKESKKAQLSWGNFYADSYGSGKVDYKFLTTAHR